MTHPVRPFLIAVIGGIACGKSYVTSLLQDFGAEIISADIVVHGLYSPSGALYLPLIQHFGPRILDVRQQIDRHILKTIILENPEKKKWLESIVHPLVRIKIRDLVEQSHAPVCVIEIPLLKDRQDYPEVDYVLYVHCDPEEQCQRLMHRNQLSELQARQLMTLSIPSEIQAQLADSKIDTTGSHAEDLKKTLLSLSFGRLLRQQGM